MRRISLIVIFAFAVLGGWLYLRHSWATKQPNVIVILIDTLRADHLGMYGYQRATSPNLDKFASENIKFTHAISASNWTPASVASLFTGLYPTSHGYNPPKVISAARKTKSGFSLPSKYLTIAELLKSHDYQTAAVSANAWISPELGFSKGFDNFTSLHRSDADQVVASAERSLDRFEQTSDRPFFLYLHFMDPHNPYDAHPESEHLFTENISSYFNFNYSAHANSRIRLYDGEILNVDIYIGKFLESLKRRGLYDSTKIIIIADHGEQFREHGKAGHGRYLYNEEVRVPLIIKSGDQPQVVDDVVSNIDVVPTIFEFIGLVPPKEFPGISLINSASRKIRTGVFSETYRDYPQQAFITNSADKIIFDVRFDRTGKLVRSLRGLYNFSDDKLEQIPLSDHDLQLEMTTKLESAYQVARSLKGNINRSKTEQIPSLLGTKIEKQTPPVAPETDETPVSSELLNQLKSLGYIGK